jgi:hypothetical protein
MASEIENRAVKVDRLISTISELAGIVDELTVAAMLRKFDDAAWKRLAEYAKCNEPSPDSRRAVFAVLEDRAKRREP